MDSLVFSCPGCQQPFQVLAEQAGQMVRCPGCEEAVQIPAPSAPAPPAQPPAEEVQPYDCPECKKAFGIYPSMFGSEMDCPHCQQTVLLTDGTESAPEIVVAPDLSSKAKRKMKREAKAKAKAKVESRGKAQTQTANTKDQVSLDGQVNLAPKSASKESANKESAQPADAVEKEVLAELPVAVFEAKPVDHLLPPKFQAVDPAFFYRRHQDGSQVLLPGENGDVKVVNNRIVKIEHNGQVYELISSPEYDRVQKSIVINLLAVLICGLVIAIVMTLLN